MNEPTLVARLRFLNRGQGWVVKRLDALVGDTLPESVSEFLEEMKKRHVINIEACERLRNRFTDHGSATPAAPRSSPIYLDTLLCHDPDSWGALASLPDKPT